MFTIIYYRKKCIGCGGCAEVAPGRWRMSRKDGRSTLLKGEEKKGIYRVQAGMDELPENELAAACCPVKVIKILGK
ncbi:MAG: ferredoxin [Saprospiraceae bacterium]